MKKSSDRKFQVFGHGLMIIYCVLCVLPFVLLFVASFTDEATIIRDGYSFLPARFSLGAYEYLFGESSQILRGYANAVFVTAVGTLLNVAMTMGLAYMLSRKDFPLHKFANFYVFFTMLFNGGLVPTYILYTNYLHVKNTYWGLIIPALLVNAFYIMIARTYISSNIPMELLEAARIDGAGEFRVYGQLVLPLSRPIVATVGLFCGLAYWNDWMRRIFSQEFQLVFKLFLLLGSQIFKMLLETGRKGKRIRHYSASNFSNRASTLSKTGCSPDAIFTFTSAISSRSSFRYFFG